jgi:hypothetical protein
MQLDLFDRLRDDEDLERAVETINPDRKYLPHEVAKDDMLRCSLATVYRLYGAGELRGIKVGSNIRIFGWSIINYILEQAN